MGISASHWGYLCAEAEAEAWSLHPRNADARRRHVSKRLGLLTRADLDEMHSEAAKFFADWDVRRARLNTGARWIRFFWKLYYRVFD